MVSQKALNGLRKSYIFVVKNNILLLENLGLTLTQRGYVLATALRETSSMTLRILAVILGFILLGVLMWNYERDIDLLIFWLIWIFILIFIVTIYYYTRHRKYFVELNKWKEDYLKQSYLLIFDTSVPRGIDTAEKVLNISRLIFPELRSDYIRYSPYYSDHISTYFRNLLKKNYKVEKNRKVNSYSLDLVVRTLRGYYIVKDFGSEMVTVNHIQNMINLISGAFRDRYQRTFVFRAVCIANQYESIFMGDELKQIMSKHMKTKIKIDLLIDDGKGYSV